MGGGGVRFEVSSRVFTSKPCVFDQVSEHHSPSTLFKVALSSTLHSSFILTTYLLKPHRRVTSLI